MTRRSIGRALVTVTAIALTGCSSGPDATTTTLSSDASVPPDDAVAVTIRGTDLSSDSVTIRGDAPTPCHELGSVLERSDGVIEVSVFSVPPDDDQMCAQVLEPFEITVGFDAPTTDTAVLVNGEEVGRVGG